MGCHANSVLSSNTGKAHNFTTPCGCKEVNIIYYYISTEVMHRIFTIIYHNLNVYKPMYILLIIIDQVKKTYFCPLKTTVVIKQLCSTFPKGFCFIKP